jgi:putative Ca2+/H+ antiporter (TMEM165/GDT1 family)
MDLSVVLSAFSLLFLAEKGDKSQLLAMTLAHRYRAAAVIAGTFAAFAVLNLLAVLVGQALFEFVPQELMLLTAAGLFLTSVIFPGRTRMVRRRVGAQMVRPAAGLPPASP